VSRRVLIVSPHFPPVNAPDMQRVRMALPHFIAAGWDVTVLTVADPSPSAPVDPELEAALPPAVRVVRARCLPRGWTGLLGIGNVAWRSLPFLFAAGCRLLLGRRHDVVYFSTTMFAVLPLGRVWRRLYGVPYVIDLQDPWVPDYYSRTGAPPPGGWKFRVAQALGRRLEGWTLWRAAHVITVSAGYVSVLRKRYPWFARVPWTELPFGSPDSDLDRVRATLADRPALLPPGGRRLAFAGAIGPGMLPAVDVLCAALAAARRAGADLSAHFFGTRYAPGGAPATAAAAARHGVGPWVRESPRRLRYFAALQVTLEADVNLVFGSTDLDFTPSKIVAVLAAGRPVLALAPTGSATLARLEALGQRAIAFDPGHPEAGIAAATTFLLAADAARPAPPAALGARAVAERQLAVLDSAAESGCGR
jgi:hypothetical protein